MVDMDIALLGDKQSNFLTWQENIFFRPVIPWIHDHSLQVCLPAGCGSMAMASADFLRVVSAELGIVCVGPVATFEEASKSKILFNASSWIFHQSIFSKESWRRV
jgi:hypothetical protein